MCRGVVVILIVLLNLGATFSQVFQTRRDETYTRESEQQRPRAPNRSCETDQLEYRLTRLEVQVGEKSENLRSELREGNRRLLALEQQASEVQSALEGFRNEMGRYAEVGQMSHAAVENCESTSRIDKRIDNLAKGMQLVVAGLRIVSGDIGWVTKNMSAIANATNTLLHNAHHLVTKQFLAHSLVDVKYNQMLQQPAANYLAPSSEDKKRIPRNCKEILKSDQGSTGIYLIQPSDAAKPFMALCNMETRGGGWTYIHNRFEGSQDFYLDMHDYKHGFGNLGGEFWLGLDKLHQLTGTEVNELLVELVDQDGNQKFAQYAAFSIGSELEGYALKVLGGYIGDAGDSLSYHAGSRFSTKDMDQDGWPEGNCASAHTGAWWYRGCDTSNLNGRYLNGELPENFLYQGMYWSEFKGAQYSLAQARMMVRPRDESSAPIFPGGVAN